MHAKRAPSANQKVELEELVSWFQAVTIVAKEKKLANLVVVPYPVSSTLDKAIDQLTKSFEKLNINIGTLVK